MTKTVTITDGSSKVTVGKIAVRALLYLTCRMHIIDIVHALQHGLMMMTCVACRESQGRLN